MTIVHKEALDRIMQMFFTGTSHNLRIYYPNLVFIEGAADVFMSIAGFIVGTHAAGNIRLAQDLAESIDYVLTNLAGRGETFAEVAPDITCMSFTFMLYAKATDQSMDAFHKMHHKYTNGEGPYVKRVGHWEFDKKTGVKVYNGGIIFHYARAIYKLDTFTEKGRAWSVHT